MRKSILASLVLTNLLALAIPTDTAAQVRPIYDQGSNALLRLILPQGFGHVCAFAQTGEGVMLVEPVEWGITVQYLQNPTAEKLLSTQEVAEAFIHENKAPIVPLIAFLFTFCLAVPLSLLVKAKKAIEDLQERVSELEKC